MKKPLLILIVVLSAIVCDGASIDWDGVNVGGFVYVQDPYFGAQGSGLICKDDEGWWVFGASLQIQVDVVMADTVKLTFSGDSGMVTQGWSLAQEGDVASYETMRNKDSSHYVMRVGHLDGLESVYHSELLLDGDTSLYLAFTCSENIKYIYGWVEMYISETGDISVLGSAYDLSGGPMVVGGGAYTDATPEPSAGVLFLLGAAALGLRRRGNCRIVQLWKCANVQ